MNRFLRGFFSILILFSLAFFLWQGSFSFSFGQPKTMTVTGTGKVKMTPEVARFTTGVQKFGTSVDEALGQEKTTTAAIISALKGSGIKEEDIKTSWFNIWPQTSDLWEGNVRRQQITGYSVSNNIEVKVREINRVSEILGKVIGAGANNVSGVSFGADDPKEQEAEAREKAIADAREKAQKMAEASGRKLGRITSITEGTLPVVAYPAYRMEGGGGAGGGPTVEPGSLEISQTVTVVFSLR